MKKKYIKSYLLIIIINIILINLLHQPSTNIIIKYERLAGIGNKAAEIFFDKGNGFNQKDSLLSKIQYDEIRFVIKNFDEIKGLRIDPVNVKGNIFIKEIIFQYGLYTSININKNNFNKYVKTNNIQNIDLENCISFESINNDPMIYINNDIFMEIKNMTNTINVKHILINSVCVILFYLLLLVAYLKRNIFIKCVKKIMSSKKYKFISINIISIFISIFFITCMYDTLIEIHFNNDIVPFNNEIKVYQKNNENINVNKTQFSSILINNFSYQNDIIIDMNLNEFNINKISLRQNTHLTFNVNIKYNIENNNVYISKIDIKTSKIIYIIINVLICNLIVSAIYFLLNMLLVRNFIKVNTVFYGILLLAIIVVLYNKFILFDKYYVFKDIASDSLFQLFPYIQHLSYYIYEKHSIPFITFFAGLGINIFSYVMEPFYFLVALFGPDNIPAMMGYMHTLRVFLAGLFFYLFLKERGYDNYTSIIFGLLYAFSGRMISQGTWQTYPNEVVGVALFLYAFELLYNNKNKYILPFSIAFLFSVTSSYYFVLYTIIITAYIIFRFYIDNINPFKNIKKIGYLFISYLIGFFIASPLIITNLIMIRSGPRSGNFNLLTDINYLKNAIFQITSNEALFTAFFRTFSPNILGIDNYTGSETYLQDPLFYCGILTVILIPLAFNYISKREKIAYFISILLIFLYIFSPFIRYALSGFSVAYWKISSFWIILLMIYISAHSLSCIIKNKYINQTLLIITVLCLVSAVGILGHKKDFIISYYYAVYLFLGIYSIVLFKINNKNIDKMMSIIIILVIVEIFTMSWMTINERQTLSLFQDGFKDGTERTIKHIESKDKSLFYRIEKDYKTFFNDPLAQNYMGIESYNNMSHRKQYNDFLNILNIKKLFNHPNFYPHIHGNIYLENLFNIKYKILKNKYDKPYFYEIIGNEGDLFIAKNNLFLPFGIYYTDNLNIDNFMKVSFEDRWLNLLKYNVTDKESNNQFIHNDIDKYKANEIYYEENGKKIKIDKDTKIQIKKIKGKINIHIKNDKNDKYVYLLKYDLKSNARESFVNFIDGDTNIKRNYFIKSGKNKYIFEISGENIKIITFANNIEGEISNLELYIVPEKIYYKPLEDAINNLRK